MREKERGRDRGRGRGREGGREREREREGGGERERCILIKTARKGKRPIYGICSYRRETQYMGCPHINCERVPYMGYIHIKTLRLCRAEGSLVGTLWGWKI